MDQTLEEADLCLGPILPASRYARGLASEIPSSFPFSFRDSRLNTAISQNRPVAGFAEPSWRQAVFASAPSFSHPVVLMGHGAALALKRGVRTCVAERSRVGENVLPDPRRAPQVSCYARGLPSWRRTVSALAPSFVAPLLS